VVWDERPGLCSEVPLDARNPSRAREFRENVGGVLALGTEPIGLTRVGIDEKVNGLIAIGVELADATGKRSPVGHGDDITVQTVVADCVAIVLVAPVGGEVRDRFEAVGDGRGVEGTLEYDTADGVRVVKLSGPDGGDTIDVVNFDTGLDARLKTRLQIEIGTLLTDLNVTGLYVTHDQEEAMVMCDRVAVMNDGRVEQVGTPREIYESPANEFVSEFVALDAPDLPFVQW